MITLKGKYNEAKIFTDEVDKESISQILNLLNQEFMTGSRVRMMPDVHAGAGCTIGTTMTITDKIVPNLVGVDIGCGVETVRLKESYVDLEKLDKVIRERIPSGFKIREEEHPYSRKLYLEELFCYNHINGDRAAKSMGTLGGGNHFIELDTDDDGNLYLIIHSGSRHLGLEVAQYYQDAAVKQLNGIPKADIDSVIRNLKAQGREREIEKTLKALHATKRTKVPKELAYIQDELFERYIHDMRIIQQYAELNRCAMVDEILAGMDLHIEESFTTIHNYIDTDAMILRKGAVSAKRGEKLLIPINMRDGSLICVGKGNDDWNQSAPHGAGRLMSRSKAKELLTMAEFREQMTGIYSTSIGYDTLDESPMTYKTMDSILENIKDTVDVLKVIKPVYNFKAGGE